MKKIIYSILFFSIGILNAQQIEKFSIDSGGDNVISEGFQNLFTIGEVHVQEYNNNIIVSEGFINPNFSGTLSVKSFLEDDVTVYPIPASESITIKSDIDIDAVEIYNVFGSKVLISKKLIIDASKLQSGFYLMRIWTKKGQLTKNIIIE